MDIRSVLCSERAEALEKKASCYIVVIFSHYWISGGFITESSLWAFHYSDTISTHICIPSSAVRFCFWLFVIDVNSSFIWSLREERISVGQDPLVGKLLYLHTTFS